MRKIVAAVGTACLVLALTVSIQADVKSRQKSQVKFEGALGRIVNMFGGKGAKEGVISTVALKGNQQLTMNDTSGELIDLDAEKIYTIDARGKSYKVMTFAEMRKQMEEAKAEARKNAGAAKGEGAAKDESGQPQFEISVDVKKTGQQKTFTGETCDQFIVTITMHAKGTTLEDGGGMVVTSDTWLGPKNPGTREMADFQRRFIRKLYGTEAEIYARDMMSALAMYPALKDGMARLQKEAAQMDGTPMFTTVTFENVMTAEQAKANQDKGGAPGLGGIAGGLGGMLGRKKKTEEPATSGSGASNRSRILTTTTEVLSFGSSVSADEVQIPVGYKLKN
jgi:hypothetical protein